MPDGGREKLRPLQLLRANSSLTHKLKTPPEEKRAGLMSLRSVVTMVT